MNSTEMLRLIDSIARDRNVDKEALFRDIEQAMVSAARKHFNAIDTEEFTAEVDRLNGKIRVFRGEEEIPLEALGRIPAQTAKQVMIQRFREDERDSIYNEFIDRVGELVTGMAQRYEGGALVCSIGRAEGFMPRSEQIPGEQHQPGERVRCLILDVREAGHQVKIVLSRAAPEFIKRLFEVEVPEVAERIIEIKAMAREAGHRTKIAVSSIDSKVDAVGACVGVRGSRIKNIVDELGGEKIDIVRWNESSQILIQNSLKPAEVVEISLCFELGRATVVVNEDQLSLAIGKRGQNVRLAARLTNWDVDILTPAEFTRSLDTLEQCIAEISGTTEDHIDRLAALGVISVFDVEEVGAEYLVESLGIDEQMANQMVELASERAKVVAEEQQREKEEAARRKEREQAELSSMPGAAQAAAILGEMLPPEETPGDAGHVGGETDGDAEPSEGEVLSGAAPVTEGEVLSGAAPVTEGESVGYDNSQRTHASEPGADDENAVPGSASEMLEARQQEESNTEALADQVTSEDGTAASSAEELTELSAANRDLGDSDEQSDAAADEQLPEPQEQHRGIRE